MSEENGLDKFVRNPWALLLHQGITFIAPIVFAIVGWVWVTAFNHYSTVMETNTQTLNELKTTVMSHDTLFEQEFKDDDQRITRLEDHLDGYRRR